MSLSRESWGPKFWKILHTLAENSGSIVSPILAIDEADTWELLLKNQAFVMPCVLCRDHYINYKSTRRIPNLRELQGEDRRDFLRKWLWSCHNNVNMITHKNILPIEDLPILYNNKNIVDTYNDICLMLSIAMQRSQLKLDDVKRWKTIVTRLRMLYSI